MNVSVERYQRRKYVSQENSPMLYYVRQKSGTVRVMDVEKLADGHRCPCRLHSEKLCHDEGRREARHRSPGGGDSRQPCQWRQGEAEPAGHFPHDVPLSRHGGLGQMYGAQYLEGEYPLYPRQGAEAGERTAVTRSPANVGFVLDKPEEGGSGGGNQGGGSGGGSGDDGDQGENPLG